MKDINTKTLTISLKEMEDDKLIERQIYPEVPPRVEYRLTEGGEDIVPIILNLKEWGEEQLLNHLLSSEDHFNKTID